MGAVLAGLALSAGLFLALVFIMAWSGGLFLRCPYCRKVGSWRFHTIQILEEEKLEGGAVRPKSRLLLCNCCGHEVLDTWSDLQGRVLIRKPETDGRPAALHAPRRPWYHLHFGPWCLLMFGLALYVMAYTQEESLRMAHLAIFLTSLAGSVCIFGAAYLEAKYQHEEDLKKDKEEYERLK